MRKFTLDNKAVRVPNASHLGFDKWKVKRGDVFTCDGNIIARSLGRIKTCDNDGEDCRGWVCALVLGLSGSHAYVRWIDPASVRQVIDCPSKLAAFFFAEKLPYDNDMILNLAAYGTLSELFIDRADHHVTAWRAGVSPAAYDAGVR